MSNYKWIGMLSIVFMLIHAGTNAQEKQKGSIDIHFGISFPLEDFAYDDLDDEGSGGAGTGGNLGVQFLIPLNQKGLGAFFGIDGAYNPLKKGVKDEIRKRFMGMGIDADIKFYEYINFPLTLGLNYTFQSDKNTNVFFRGAVVANFLKTTDYTVAVGTSKLSIVFDWAKNYGFKVGGGVLINKKTIIALDL